ncbi:hypothetical protein AAH991_02135 [Microbispora sp. ZYX-F-249]|uniref:Uncharacterized protein n=1 Tax=Microbispora maris TaxID=3144104 RepID=A0ABV0AEW1_9ACTN
MVAALIALAGCVFLLGHLAGPLLLRAPGLLELAADDHAAHHHGRASLIGALRKLAVASAVGVPAVLATLGVMMPPLAC